MISHFFSCKIKKERKKNLVQWPFKTSDKSPYDPRAPITNSYCKSSLCIFVCLNAASKAEKKEEEKNSEGKDNWRNVKIQRTVTWRAEVLGKWRFSRTPSMLETSDQNGTVDNDILYPYFIFSNFERLS